MSKSNQQPARPSCLIGRGDDSCASRRPSDALVSKNCVIVIGKKKGSESPLKVRKRSCERLEH